MVKIFGEICGFCSKNFFIKVLFLFFLTNSFVCKCVKLNLNILSTDGFKLEKAAVGVPFILEVSIQDLNSSQEPTIDGLQDFHVGQRSFQIRTINGNSSLKNSFHVRIDKPGVYKIGPAKIDDGGQIYKSDVLELDVVNDQVIKGDQDKNNNTKKDIFLKLSADKENIVLGEKINCILRFYYLDGQDVKIDGVAFPELKDIKKEQEKKPTAGTEKIDEELYNYVQWVFTIIPKRVGKVSVPAIRGVFSVALQEDVFGGFAAIFGHLNEQKSIFSNSLNFNVESLPKYDGVVDAVGRFISFEASVDRVVGKQGDGIVYTLQLEGLGDLDEIAIKELKNMPRDLKYYDSKRYMLDNSAKDGMKKKRFEFIVQGLQAGDVVIPGQSFTFFDTQTRKYKVLKSNSVNLKILPTTAITLKNDSNLEDGGVKKTGKLDSDNHDNIDIMRICQNIDWYSHKENKINFWLFLFLVFLPIILSANVFLKKSQSRLLIFYFNNLIKKNSFARALRNLDIAKNKNDFTCLYQIFITFFSERFGLDGSFVTSDKIIEVLVKYNFSQQDLQEWESFIEKIMAYAFCDKGKVGHFDITIFSQAIGWVDKFKQKVEN